jgi:glycosyltransferase involved in cell wall biosynthesis
MKPTILYFINSFNRGGAELGLKTLIEGGFFDGSDLSIVSIVRGNGTLAESINTLGHTPIVLTESVTMRPHHVVIAGVKLARIIAARKPDIIILSLPQANILGRLVARAFRVKKIVSFEHNTHLAKPIYERLFRLTSCLVHTALADCSETARVVTQRLYIRHPSEVHVVPLVQFPAPPAPSVCHDANPSDTPRIVSVGRLTHVKNHEAIIRAVHILKIQGFNIHLDIIGEGPLHDMLEALCANLNISDRVTLRGFVPDWWKQGPYNAFVLASKHEGLCIVALEAMWASIPVIAPLVGGVRDYGNNATMRIIPDTTPDSIADTLRAHLKNPEDGRTRAQTARDTVMVQFSQGAVRQTYASVRNSLTSNV